MAPESTTDRRLHISNRDNNARPQMRAPKKERSMPVEITDSRQDRFTNGNKDRLKTLIFKEVRKTSPFGSPSDRRQCNRSISGNMESSPMRHPPRVRVRVRVCAEKEGSRLVESPDRLQDLTNRDRRGRPQMGPPRVLSPIPKKEVRPQTARVSKAIPVDRNQDRPLMRPGVRVSTTTPTPKTENTHRANSENEVRSKLPSRVRVPKAKPLDNRQDRDDKVRPQLPSWGDGESPRGRRSHGLLALLDRGPTYQFGYAFSCGYEELEMGGFDSGGGPCTSTASDLDVFTADDFSSNAGNSQSNDEINIRTDGVGIDIAGDSNTNETGCKSKVYVMRRPQGIGSNSVTTLTTVDSPSYGLSNAGIRKKERLVEVFSFRFNNRKDCGDVYGAIKVLHSCGYMYGSYIFHRLPGDPKGISLYDDTLSFVGPTRAIYCCDWFHMTLELKDKNGDLFPGYEESYFELIERELDEIEYGKLMSKVFPGKFGPATLYYTVFDDAVEAHVKVEHFQGDLVFGSIVASYGHYNYSTDEERNKYCKSVLFYKPSSDCVKLKLLKALPITRVVAVPTSSFLVIEANLWNYNQRNRDDHIADGKARFPAQAPGETSVKDIEGDIGFARVTVVWKSALRQGWVKGT